MPDETKTISLGNIAEGVALTVALGFVVSVIYDWGFFYALDFDFSTIPTATSDHFRTGVLWFPKLLAIILAYFAIEFQFKRIERGLTEDEIVGASSSPSKLKAFREGPGKFIQWVAPLAVLNYILIGDAYSSMQPIMLSITWMAFAEWCYSVPLIQMRRSRDAHVAFTFLPIVVILAFFSGYNAAVDGASRDPVAVAIDNGQPTSPIKGRVLRTFERGIFILGDDNHFLLIPWDQVHAVHTEKPYTPFRGVLCEWFGRCASEKAASNHALKSDLGDAARS